MPYVRSILFYLINNAKNYNNCTKFLENVIDKYLFVLMTELDTNFN